MIGLANEVLQFSVLIFVEAGNSLMSFIQVNSFYFWINTHNEHAWMYHNRYVLCSIRRPPRASFHSEKVSS